MRPIRYFLSLSLLVTASVWTQRPRAEEPKRSSLSHLAAQLSEEVQLERPAFLALGPSAGALGRLSPEAQARFQKRALAIALSALPGVVGKHELPVDLAEAQKRARLEGRKLRAELDLLYARFEIHDAELLLLLDRYELPARTWDRVRHPSGKLREHHAFKSTVDTEVRSLLPPRRPLLSEQREFPLPSSDLLAMGCGSFSLHETALWLVGRRDIRRVHFAENDMITDALTSWSDHSPLAKNPLRAPLFGIYIHSDAAIIGSSDRKWMLSLSPGQSPELAPRHFPSPSGTCQVFTETGIQRDGAACAELFRSGRSSVSPPAGSGPEGRVLRSPKSGAKARTGAEDERSTGSGATSQALAYSVFLQKISTMPDGTVETYEITRRENAERVLLEVQSATRARRQFSLDQLGSQIAVEDLDGDGTLDLLASDAAIGPDPRHPDQLKWYRLSPEGPELVQARPMEPIRAIAICPFAGENPLTTIVAAGEKLYLWH